MEKSEYLLKKFKIFKYWRNIYWRNSIKENPGLNEFHWWIPLITEGEIIPNSFTEKNEGSNLKSQSDSWPWILEPKRTRKVNKQVKLLKSNNVHYICLHTHTHTHTHTCKLNPVKTSQPSWFYFRKQGWFNIF